MRRILSAAVFAAAAALLMGVQPSMAALTWQTLKLKNGWVASPYDTAAPAIAIDGDGIVHMRGGMANTTATSCDHFPFLLPKKFRPGHAVFVPVDLGDGTTGRIDIFPTYVQVEPAGAAGDPDDSNLCAFTSLEGVTYSK